MKRYYVYKITFTDESYYIGYRGSSQAPEQDFLKKYFSSSKVVRSRIENSESYKGEILYRDMDQKAAYESEQKLIYENFNDKKILNRACYYGRDGFGIISESAKKILSKKTKDRWQDPEYRSRLSDSQSKAWSEERKKNQSERLTGKKRPEHAEKLRGRTLTEEQKQKLRKPKHDGHGKKVSAAFKGKPKSEEHKQKLRKPKPKVICRLHDRKLMAMGNYMNWLSRQSKVEISC
jgi:hypothetical protein